jgi:hypothetical protein
METADTAYATGSSRRSRGQLRENRVPQPPKQRQQQGAHMQPAYILHNVTCSTAAVAGDHCALYTRISVPSPSLHMEKLFQDAQA